VTTKLLSGATESVLFRPHGIACYGFTPLLTTRQELETGHGDDERVREASVRQAVGVFYEVVRDVARGR
jgi:acetylornithine deacetylase/succinyl-diaminopimelate desuccinylase-like protein